MAYTIFNDEDIIDGNIVRGVTSTAFSNNSGSLIDFFYSGTQTASAAGAYHWEVYNLATSDASSEVQFSIAYGQVDGKGTEKQTGASSGYTPSKTVYNQFRNILLEDTEESTKFGFGDNTFADRMYFITMNRARYKQGVNAGNWELHLSSSNTSHPYGKNGEALKLIDDSSVSNGNTVNGHLVYNIISGSDTTLFTDANDNYHYWGLFYPELGIFALNGDRIISGSGAAGDSTYGLQLNTGGSTATLNGTTTDGDDAMNQKLFESIDSGSYFALRAEEDVTSTHFFVRARNREYNYSTNPTYQTGSNGQLRHTSFIQNPQSYITTVGLYNNDNELLAIAKLSKPLLKNFERETTIRVKLDY